MIVSSDFRNSKIKFSLNVPNLDQKWRWNIYETQRNTWKTYSQSREYINVSRIRQNSEKRRLKKNQFSDTRIINKWWRIFQKLKILELYGDMKDIIWQVECAFEVWKLENRIRSERD